jgi:hypothetical protein
MLALGLIAVPASACEHVDGSPSTSSLDAALGTDAAHDAAELDADSDADSDADVPYETTMDRCNGSVCLPSRLLPQPDLEFLEPMGGGWLRLMEADWEIAPTSEGYRCMTFTLPEDVLISAFAPQSPPGTHHSTFAVSATATVADAVVACGVGLSGDRRLQGSGAGTGEVAMPPGVAMRVRAGEQITMNLHLFNIDEQPLRGRSGMWVKTVTNGELTAEAETVLAGPLNLFIPIGRSTQRGSCTLTADATIFSVGPHMHQKGVHMRATVSMNRQVIELYDGAYDFNHQLVYPVEELELEAGDKVNVECTYENDTDGPLHWGDSSLDEMCFISLGLYPALGRGSLPCAM